jgi:hypothetical protein
LRLTGAEGGDQAEPTFFTRWRRSRVWRVASVVLAVVAIGLSSYYVVIKLASSIRQMAGERLQVRPWPVAISFAMTLACVLLGGLVWYLVLRGVGAQLGLRACTQSHLLSTLGAYLPGYGWRYAGKAYLTQRQGIPLGLASCAVLVELVESEAARGVLALTTAPRAFLASFLGGALVPYAWGLRVLGWGALLVLPLALERGVVWAKRRGRRPWSDMSIDKRALWLALGVMCITFVLYGAGFAVLLGAASELTLDGLAAAIFSTSSSSAISLIMFFVPAGLSVRESVIIYTLEGVFPEAMVTVGALVSRGVLVVAEVVGSLVGSWLALSGRRRSSPKG